MICLLVKMFKQAETILRSADKANLTFDNVSSYCWLISLCMGNRGLYHRALRLSKRCNLAVARNEACSGQEPETFYLSVTSFWFLIYQPTVKHACSLFDLSLKKVNFGVCVIKKFFQIFMYIYYVGHRDSSLSRDAHISTCMNNIPRFSFQFYLSFAS